jgi:hypothetical protein
MAWLTVDYTDRAPGRPMTYLEGAPSCPFRELSGIATRALVDVRCASQPYAAPANGDRAFDL